MPPAPNQASHVGSWLLGIEEDHEELIGLPSSDDAKFASSRTTRTTSSLVGTPDPVRTLPTPNTVLDRTALLRALVDVGIVIKSKYIDYLYEHLHRENYPPLNDFIHHYRNVVADSHPGDHYSVSSEESVASYPGTVSSVNDGHYSQHHRYLRHRLPTTLLNFLQNPRNGFVTTTSQVVDKQKGANGNATKLIIALHDGLLIETHIMRYREHNGNHASVSVSSQVGCDVQCSAYCPVSSMGFKGNLSSGEILEQVVHAQQVFAQDNPVTSSHIVQKVTFMGSGEPLLNYDHVVHACHDLSNKRSWNLCRGRITIATVGITPRIYDLTRDLPNVIVALGLHAPTQDLRRAIIPIAQEYPLDELMEALDAHMNEPQDRINGSLQSLSGRKRSMVMVEYIMMEGKTSSLECAHKLGKLCENRPLVVNLIPYIVHSDDHDERTCPTPTHIREFQSIVSSYGTICNVRLNMCAQMSRRVSRQLGQERLASFCDVPEDLEGLSFWQKLSFVRFRGWNKEALRHRQEKRRASIEVPREIVTQNHRAVPCNNDRAISTTTAVACARPSIAVDGTACCISKIDSHSASTGSCVEFYRARRWILSVAAVSTAIAFGIVVSKRRRRS